MFVFMNTSKIATDVHIVICYIIKRLDAISLTFKNYLTCHLEWRSGLSVWI